MRLLDILIGTLVVFPLLADALLWDVLARYSLDASDVGLPLLMTVALVLAARRLRAPGGRLWSSVALLGGCMALLGFLYWAVAGHALEADRVSAAVRKLTYGTGAYVVIG